MLDKRKILNFLEWNGRSVIDVQSRILSGGTEENHEESQLV
jgi:hypothetical protein